MNPSPVHPTRKTKTTMARFCVIADRHMMSALHIMFLVWCLHVVLLQTVIQSLNQRVNSEKVVPLVCDKLQLIWTGDFQSLKRFMSENLKLNGVWSQPGGDKIVFSDGLSSISYGEKTKKLCNSMARILVDSSVCFSWSFATILRRI